MTEQLGPLIKVAPFVQGVATRVRVIVRRADRPAYLALTAAEVETARLLTSGARLDDFLANHLSGRGILDFKAAVGLVLKLHQAQFIENTTDDMQARLAEFSANRGGAATRFGALIGGLQHLLDLPLVRFSETDVHPAMRALGKGLVSMPVLLATAVALLTLTVLSGVAMLPEASIAAALLSDPARLIAQLFLTFSAAASWLAFLQMAALAGTGARFVGGAIRLTGFCVLRLAIQDEDALILARPAMLRYFAVALAAPWLSALGCWQIGLATSSPFMTLTAFAFALIGLMTLCPLYRGPLVRMGEGILATLDVLEQATSYLNAGIFSGLSKKAAGKDADASQIWITAFATITILWLYGMSLLFSDALVAAVPDLLLAALDMKAPLAAASAALLLLLLGAALVVPLGRLAAIPFLNLAALASLPLHRARRGISSFYSQTMPPTAALRNFLAEIPILAGLDSSGLARVSASLRYRRYGAGQTIIKIGEPGEEFFILADGRAQVVVGGAGTPEQIVDVLNPGDSFGEIALVENVRRTATIRALTPCKTLILHREAFDQVFPDGSEERQRLTAFIRQVKLVLESEALSHLAPRQVRELLAHVTTEAFDEGAFLMREDTDGDSAYLIESGEVQVVREAGSREVAILGRGHLVGAISLIKGVRRTASVRARTPVTCLKIDKPTFLGMCMSNMFVALLVADLSDRQIAETRKAG